MSQDTKTVLLHVAIFKISFFPFAFCYVSFCLNGYGECVLEVRVYPFSTFSVSSDCNDNGAKERGEKVLISGSVQNILDVSRRGTDILSFKCD